jgi:O-antigen ligase
MNSNAATAGDWSAPQVSEMPVERDSVVLLARVVSLGILGLLIFGPLALGGVEPWAVLVLEVGTATLFSLWCVRQLPLGQMEIVAHPLLAPAGFFALLIACQILFRRSVYVDATISQALKYAAYGMLVFLTAQAAKRRSDLKYLAMSLTVFGFVFAVFAMLQSLSGTAKIYWFHEPSSSNAVIFGSYANHNHYAGLMELLIPFPLVFSLSELWRGAKRTLWAFAAVVMSASLFLSKSRGGMIAFVVQLLFVGWLSLRRRSKYRYVSLAAATVLLVAILLWLDSSGLIRERVTSLGNPMAAAGIRFTILQDSGRMFAARPLLGWGLDVFPIAYPQYRSFATDFFVNQAHNDYLQVLVETGAIGFLLVLFFLYRLYRNALPHTREWTHDLKSSVRTAALVGCTGLLVHSFSDFNLHVPANAALFYVLALIAAAPDNKPAHSSTRRVRRRS